MAFLTDIHQIACASRGPGANTSAFTVVESMSKGLGSADAQCIGEMLVGISVPAVPGQLDLDVGPGLSGPGAASLDQVH